MSDWKIQNSKFVCPKCSTAFNKSELDMRPSPAPKGSGGCIQYASCPNCTTDNCVKRDRPALTMSPF